MTTIGSALSPAAREVILALADDEHLMGQHHTEWIGVAPFIEEDLAFSSIGQDELGHAAMLYELCLDAGPEGADDQAIDGIAYFRQPGEYRSCWLTERPTSDWAEAVIRHWLYDLAEELRWELFRSSSVAALVEIANRVEREEIYHRRHADGLLDVLLADAEAASRLREGLAVWLPLGSGLFDPVALEPDAVAQGVQSAPLASQRPRWEARIEERFGPVSWGTAPDQNGRTVRSDAFGPLLARMREVIDLDPTAIW